MGPASQIELHLLPALMAISFVACSAGSERLLSPPVPTDLETDPGDLWWSP